MSVAAQKSDTPRNTVDSTRALKVAGVVSLVLLGISTIEFMTGGLLSDSGYLLSTILPALIFFACLVSLAFFRSTVLQRFLILSFAVVLYCVPMWIELFQPDHLTGLMAFFPLVLLYRFMFSLAGVSSVLAAIVFAARGLGKAKATPARRDDIEEDALFDLQLPLTP